MLRIENNQRYYNGFKVVSSLKRNKKKFKYGLNNLHLEKIIAVLNQAKHTMLQPQVAHIAIFINDSFDCKTLTQRLRRVFGSENMLFTYSVEMKNKLHIHLMLVLDCKNLNPATVFYHSVLPVIKALKNVEGCVLNPRWHWKDKKTAKYTHDLKKDYEFRDAIERYSYFAKENDKNKVVTIYKKFATSQIKNNKYYSILGTENMIKIKQIHKNEKLQFSSNDAALNKKYINFRKTVNDENETKSMYHFVDTSENNKAIGYYGYSYGADIDNEHYILIISIDDLYIEPMYLKIDSPSSCFDVLYLHLRDEMNKVLGQVKNELKDHQKLMINSMAYENLALEELLGLVVSSAAEEHSLIISQPEMWMI